VVEFSVYIIRRTDCGDTNRDISLFPDIPLNQWTGKVRTPMWLDMSLPYNGLSVSEAVEA
jgi:hypothetical protein